MCAYVAVADMVVMLKCDTKLQFSNVINYNKCYFVFFYFLFIKIFYMHDQLAKAI